MKVFAISDLHLSTTVEKPMDIFGSDWDNHFEKISADWKSKVSENDIVLLGGDLSWGINIDEARSDYELINTLPGTKIVVKGNHDYYWQSLNKMRSAFPDFGFIQNNSYRIESEKENGIVIAGTRGWLIPTEASEDHDKEIYNHELLRLRMSLDSAKSKMKDADHLIVMLHFPPFDCEFHSNEMTSILEEYHPETVLYGHIHGKQVRAEKEIVKSGIKYILTSCDLIDNKLINILEF